MTHRPPTPQDAADDYARLKEHCQLYGVDPFDLLRESALVRTRKQESEMTLSTEKVWKFVTSGLPILAALVSVVVFATRASTAADNATQSVQEVKEIAQSAKALAVEANTQIKLAEQNTHELRRRLEELKQGQEKTNDLLMQLYLQQSAANGRRPTPGKNTDTRE